MTWHTHNYEPSIYSPEQAEASLQTFCLDTYLSELAKSNPTPGTSCSPDSGTESCQPSPYGTTCAPSMENRGEDQLTFFAEDFPVKTCPTKAQTTEQSRALVESAAGFGQNIKDLLGKLNLSLSLPKTHRIYGLADLSPCSKTLPVWGMMQGGAVLEVATRVRIIVERESGYLPTSLATDWKGGATAIRKDKGKQRLDQWRHYVKVKFGMTYPHPTHSDMRMGWPENWTDLKPLEMGKFRKWLRSHGIH